MFCWGGLSKWKVSEFACTRCPLSLFCARGRHKSRFGGSKFFLEGCSARAPVHSQADYLQSPGVWDVDGLKDDLRIAQSKAGIEGLLRYEGSALDTDKLVAGWESHFGITEDAIFFNGGTCQRCELMEAPLHDLNRTGFPGFQVSE